MPTTAGVRSNWRFGLFLAALVLVVFAGRWSLRQFMAESLTAYGDDVASRDEAVRRAPGNPSVIAARGKHLFYRAEPPREEEGIAALREAVRLVPDDYRYWLELGRAYEQSAQTEAALAATSRAVGLAPRYFETHWTLANLQLRAGMTDAALAEFRAALQFSEGRPGRTNGRAALNVFEAVTRLSGLNPEALRRVAPGDATAQAWLAWHLAGNGALDQGLEIFRGLPVSAENGYPDLIFQLLHASQAAGRYGEAAEVWGRLRGLAGRSPESGGNLMENGGFEEQPLDERYEQLTRGGLGFDWLIDRHPQVQVRRDDAQSHSGRRSLHLGFSRPMEVPFAQVTRLVTVEPSRHYNLRFWVRAVNLPAEAPWIEVGDAHRPEAFLLRVELPRQAAGWEERSIGLMTLPETRALRLRLHSPAYRFVSTVDRGDLWLDDFELVQAP